MPLKRRKCRRRLSVLVEQRCCPRGPSFKAHKRGPHVPEERARGARERLSSEGPCAASLVRDYEQYLQVALLFVPSSVVKISFSVSRILKHKCGV